MTNTMSGSAGTILAGLRMAWPARRPSGRPVLVVLLMAGLALSSRGVNAIALSGMSAAGPERAAPAVTETAALQVEARRLLAQYRGNPPALRDSAGAALAAGRNDATVAVFLKRRWAGRLSAGLERYGAMLASADVQQLAFAAASGQGAIRVGPGRNARRRVSR